MSELWLNGEILSGFLSWRKMFPYTRLDITEESDRENQIKNSHFSANSKLMKLSMNAWNYLQAGFGKESGSVAI